MFLACEQDPVRRPSAQAVSGRDYAPITGGGQEPGSTMLNDRQPSSAARVRADSGLSLSLEPRNANTLAAR